MNRNWLIPALVVIGSIAGGSLSANEPDALLAQSRARTPAPPWPPGDERGMANQIGPATWARCAWHLSHAEAKAYEVSHLRSNSMPLSPFTGPYVTTSKPSRIIPGTVHVFNSEELNQGATPAEQGTQIDALGHVGFSRHRPMPKGQRQRTTRFTTAVSDSAT